MSKSSTSGGIGIGTIIFWVVMWNIFFGDDDEDKKPVDTTAKVSLEEKVNTIGDKVGIDLEILGNKVSVQLDSFIKKVEDKLDNEEKVVAKSPKKENKVVEVKKAKKSTTLKDEIDDPYKENDLYGSTEDKY